MLLAEKSDSVASPVNSLDETIERARAALLELQNPDGHWCGELQGDSILESEYILMKYVLGQELDPCLPKLANYLRKLQQPNGGWNLYPGGPPDMSGSVKAYFALKLMGDHASAPHMRRACALIRSMGGAEKCNSFSKFYFAILGQISFDACPSIPPEIVFLPKWSYFNLYHISSWTRAMILPLAIVTTLRPSRHVSAEMGISELYLDHQSANRVGRPAAGPPRSWGDIFLRLDQALKIYDMAPLPGLREAAIKRAEQWMLQRMEDSEGLGAIFPSMVYSLIVFRLLGYADNHPHVKRADDQLRDFFIEEGDTIRLQPCLSPVWDTGIAMHALAETGFSENEAQSAADWLLGKECRIASDWLKNCPGYDASEGGGWYFEYANPHYPDTDDTAMACVALSRLGGDRAAAAIARGRRWLLAMQNDDGGWAAFDRTTPRPILEKIPFADHNAMQDPSCPDITGRVLEGLGHCGATIADAAVQRGIAFIRGQQDESGAWWGRWGVNYVYGTWQVLVGLRSVGQDMNEPWIRKAAEWLASVQKADGSWGETPASYDDPTLKGTGKSTASQTAWGTMGLMAANGADDERIARGVEWLIAHQRDDGNWREDEWTGTGFPKVFYLKYHLYRLYFPLMALARFKRLKD